MTRLIIGLLLTVFSQFTFSAGKWRVGFNEPFIAQYLLHNNLYCIVDYDPNSSDPFLNHPQCPENMIPRDYTMIQTRLLDLAASQHVGTYREIIPVAQLVPEPNVNRFSEAADIVDIYENYDLFLTIAFGITVPLWMSPGVENMWHPMPTNSGDWTTLKNNLSFAMGDFIQYLKDDPRISDSWIERRLSVEGFNEFNSLKTGPLATPANSYALSTVDRAVALEGGINWVLDYYGIDIMQLLMPSISGNSATINSYLYDYYNNYGGASVPNIHIYESGSTASSMITNIRNVLIQAEPYVPVAHQGKIFLSEAGTPDNLGTTCTSGLPIPERELLYRGIAEDSYISSATEAITFWRLMNLPGVDCESLYGVIHQDNSGYKVVGTNLFDYLKN